MLPQLASIFIVIALAGIAVLLAMFWRRRAQVIFIKRLLHQGPDRRAKRRIIVSLSTLPDRIGNLEPTIRSLLEQTRPPDEIVLSLPDSSTRQARPYTLPDYLSRLPVRILYCGRDWGPATKFIPIVQEELREGRGDTLIMVVDDDRIYPAHAVETYLHYNHELPDAALCFRGAPMPAGLKWTKPKLCLGAKIRRPRKVAVMMGCGSYLIQPRFFDAQLWDYSAAPAAAFYMDDIWISGWLDRGGVAKYVVPTEAMMRNNPLQRSTMTLDEVPNGRRWSNNEVIRFFADSWNVFLPTSGSAGR